MFATGWLFAKSCLIGGGQSAYKGMIFLFFLSSRQQQQRFFSSGQRTKEKGSS